jgi:periplasmic protein CpxP/Spy
MRALTRISTALVLGLFLTGAMWAQTTDQTDQNPAPPANTAPNQMGPRAQRGFQMMAQQLNLSEQQQTQMQGIMQTQRQQAQAIRQDTSLTPEQRRQKMQELRQSTHQQMMGMLTPDQQQKWQQLRSQHQGMRRDWKGRGGMGPGGGLAALNLTPDQKAQIDPIFQSSRQQVQAVRGDTSLTPDQKQAKIRDIRQNSWSQINSLLTPDQQQQWQQMRQRRGRMGNHGQMMNQGGMNPGGMNQGGTSNNPPQF